ncbi:MAG: RNA 3'-terminal phosphate cyclase [Candidatus Nanohaloarchaea archaeon]
MINIDGAKGGGQMLRTALSLSAITGRGFSMENIRGSRSSPGLKNQHLEAVRSVARLCDAEVEGDEEGSRELVFEPGELEVESFTANIGTAGSITLLFDTVLPVATQFASDFRFDAKGGTDVKWSPTLAYFSRVKLPLLSQSGLKAGVDPVKTGFYPAGGGEAVLETREFSMQPIELKERGELERFEIYSKASRELEDRDVAERQADEAARMLKNSHVSATVEKDVGYEKTASPGSSLMVKAVYEESIAGFDALGERGKRSEEVAKDAVQEFKSFHATGAAVDPYMADQLIVFLAIVGGRISIPEVTGHVQTNLGVVEKFGKGVELDDSSGRIFLRSGT